MKYMIAMGFILAGMVSASAGFLEERRYCSQFKAPDACNADARCEWSTFGPRDRCKPR